VLHRVLLRCGFSSGELTAVSQPTLVVTGGRSHPRFADVSDRLRAVLPDARAAMFPDRHHGSSPHRNEPERMAELLLALWSRA
jgi:pimeloyl-ACP methyl ester carboxylesterase